jgi:hypothetical protein
MKLEFAWIAGPAGPMAVCTSDVSISSGVSPLSCLLTDDGGLDRSTSVAWLREGVARVDGVLAGDAKRRSEWHREDWGASLTEIEANVYSLHDTQCAERIPTPKFRRALVEWVNFLEAESGANTVIVDLA